MEENLEWRTIDCFERYEVSNAGQVRNKKTAKELKPFIVGGERNQKYLKVRLYTDNGHKDCRVHRLVAMAFIPNPNNLPDINHKDENPQNNMVSNLEWCNKKDNNNYGTRNTRLLETRDKNNSYHHRQKVAKYTMNGEFVEEYESMREAARQNGFYVTDLSHYFNNDTKQLHGYTWKKLD